MLVAIAVVAVAIVATFLRQRGIPKVDTMWAEDGKVFAACAYARGPLACVAQPYEGYLQLVPRLAAVAVPIGAPEDLPLRTTLASGVIAALAGVLAARAVADRTRSMVAGFLAGVGLVLPYPAGVEVLGNLTNLHWILLASAITVVVTAWGRRRPRVEDLVLVGATALSSALGPLLVPLALVAVVRRTARARILLLVALVSSAVQVAVLLTSTRTPVGRDPLTPIQVAGGTWRTVVLSAWFGPGHPVWNLGVVVLAAALLACVAVLPRTRPRRERLLAAAEVAVIPLTGLAVYWVTVILNRTTYPHRYPYEPAALTIAAVALSAGWLSSMVPNSSALPTLRTTALGRLASRELLAGAVSVALLVGFALSFRVPARASRGPNAFDQLVAGRSACAAGVGSVRIRISPDYRNRWYVDVPCAEYANAGP